MELEKGVKVLDLVAGSGTKAKKNSQVTLLFDCQLESNKDVVMSSGQNAMEITLGAKDVLDGWNIGLNGVSKGSKRVVLCPPKTAYGAFGYPPKIPGHATLTYIFTIISVKNTKNIK